MLRALRFPVLFLLLCYPAISDLEACEIKDYNREEPPAEGGTLQDQRAHFTYSSDADPGSNSGVIWSYITNLSDHFDLDVDWRKAGIRIAMSNPLPPGKTTCKRRPVENFGWKLDFDAPILYGSSNDRQDAAAYVVKDTISDLQLDGGGAGEKILAYVSTSSQGLMV